MAGHRREQITPEKPPPLRRKGARVEAMNGSKHMRGDIQFILLAGC